MLVGKCEIVPTQDSNIKYVISAPTMRVGMSLEKTTTNPYLAARAVFLLLKKGVFKKGDLKGEKVSKEVKSIAFPGLGTGVGGVTAEACAFQVIRALEDVLLDGFSFPVDGQPKELHHELWQIDKPYDIIDSCLENYCYYFRKNQSKAMFQILEDDSSLIYNKKTFTDEKKNFGIF